MANVFGGQKLVENDDLTSVEFKVHLLLFAYLLSLDVIRKYEASLSCMSEKYGWFSTAIARSCGIYTFLHSVVYKPAKPLNRSEAEGDLAMINQKSACLLTE